MTTHSFATGFAMKQVALLVDDDTESINGTARLLHEQPFQLYTARSGQDAMAAIKAHNIDVVVAEEQMPQMSGTKLLIWVRNYFPEVARIILTGHPTVENAARSINEAGVFHYLTKPCSGFDLAVAIRKALEHKALIQENRRLLESCRQEAARVRQYTCGLESLAHKMTLDIQKPLETLDESCHAFVEHCGDALDPTARRLIENTRQSIAEIQRLVNELTVYRTRDRTVENTDRTEIGPIDTAGQLASAEPASSL